MNKKAKAQTVQTGFFRRLFSYLTFNNYKNKLDKQKYMANWENIKWKYRAGKFAFLLTFLLGGKYLFIDKVLKMSDIEKDTVNLNNDFRNLIKENLSSNINLEENFTIIKNQLKNTIDITTYFNISNKVLEQDKDLSFIYNISKFFFESLQKKFTNDYDSNPKKGFPQLFKAIKLNKKFDINNIPEELASLIKISEETYKKLFTGMCSNNEYILFSTNLVEDLKNQEEVAFVIALNLVEYFYNKSYITTMQEELVSFFDKINDKNFNSYSGKYLEDIKFIYRDLANLRNIKNILLVNPFIQINFPKEQNDLKKRLNEIHMDFYLTKIENALRVLQENGYNLKNLLDFKFDNIYCKLLDIRDQDDIMKNRIEKFFKKKLRELNLDVGK